MRLTAVNPTVLRIEDVEAGQLSFLKAQLQYHDKKVDFEISSHKRKVWQYQPQEYADKMRELQERRVKSLLFKDDDGYWTWTGLAPMLVKNFKAATYMSQVVYPQPQALPWARKPFDPFVYQREAQTALDAARHAGVEMGTGLGKSLIITYVIKSLGLKTVVMAPSKSIAKQLFDGLKSAFGGRYVGFFGDGRKDLKKLITVAISASLTRIEKDTPAWNAFAKTQVFIADESHMCPAQTLAKVCFGLLADAPYRFFFSATQLRNDGLDLLLDSITGPIVYRMTVKEGIDKGFLAKIFTTVVDVKSDDALDSPDVLKMTRKHLYYNIKVNRIAGQLATKFASSGKRVLILIEELKQFADLLPHIMIHDIGFAHGGDPHGVVPDPHRQSDPPALVATFNEGKLPILVGTSCVGIGTDIKANSVTIYLRGGKSEIEVMQAAIGRSTRLHPPVGKTSCQIIDFDVVNVESLHRHTKVRKKFYDLVGPVQEWKR